MSATKIFDPMIFLLVDKDFIFNRECIEKLWLCMERIKTILLGLGFRLVETTPLRAIRAGGQDLNAYWLGQKLTLRYKGKAGCQSPFFIQPFQVRTNSNKALLLISTGWLLKIGFHVLFNRFFGNNHQDPAVLAANDIDFHGSSDGPIRQKAMKIIHALNVRAVDGHNQIPHP